MRILRRAGLYESSKVTFISVDEIYPNPFQPRKSFDEASLRELSESISLYGILQPLTVRRTGRRFELVSGERRLRAAKMADFAEVPCIILEIDDKEASIIALVENLQRKDLDFFEEAEGLQQLIRLYGMSQDEAARRIGKSQSAVANKLRLLRLSFDILALIRENGLSERHARALLRLSSDAERLSALSEIIRRDLTVAKTEEYIESLLAGENEPPAKSKRPVYIIRDVRFFLNTLNRGVDIMKRSGVNASVGQNETDTDIVFTVKIPKLPYEKA